jgi:hypothetical protein
MGQLKDAITLTRWTQDGDVRLRSEFRVMVETLISQIRIVSSKDDVEEYAKAQMVARLRQMLYGEIMEDLKDITRTLDMEEREVYMKPWELNPLEQTREKISLLRTKILHILS